MSRGGERKDQQIREKIPSLKGKMHRPLALIRERPALKVDAAADLLPREIVICDVRSPFLFCFLLLVHVMGACRAPPSVVDETRSERCTLAAPPLNPLEPPPSRQNALVSFPSQPCNNPTRDHSHPFRFQQVRDGHTGISRETSAEKSANDPLFCRFAQTAA